MSTKRSPLGADAAGVVVLILLNAELYRKVLRLWWTFDDANTLHINADHSLGAVFTNRSAWPQQLFTPLMNAAFKAEQMMFGLHPARWYAAQLALACVVTIAVFVALRMFFATGPALSAAAVFAAGPPLCSIVTQLSTVHYFIAILFGVLATIAFVGAARRRSLLLAIASALLYLAAMLAKEIAVPLPVLLFALGDGTLRSRLRSVMPNAVALAVYFAWRRAVIGAFFGAYGWVIGPSEWPKLIALLPWRVARAAGGVDVWSGSLLVASIVAMAILAVRNNRRALIIAAAIAFMTLLPLVPVAKEVNRRYVVAPWLGCAVVVAAGASALRSRRAIAAVLIVIPVLTIFANRQEWVGEFGRRLRMSDEGRVFFEMPPNGLLRNPLTPPEAMRELDWLKTVVLQRPPGAAWFFDDYYLCANNVAGKRIWQFDPRRRAVVETTGEIPAVAARHCASIRPVPLSVAFHFRETALYWDFGPYEDGKYTALLNEGVEAFVVPRAEALNLPGATGLNVRVRYDSPQGWTTYSPAFALDFVHHPDLTWRR